MISGFHLGNSPYEYQEQVVKGKVLIFCSTNGSKALAKSKMAKNILMAAFVNVEKVAEFARRGKDDVVILCAGKLGKFSVEDAVCGGMLVARLQASLDQCGLNDGALAAWTLYEKLGDNSLNLLTKSRHGQYLIEIGAGEDLQVCAGVNTIGIVPVLRNGVIRAERF